MNICHTVHALEAKDDATKKPMAVGMNNVALELNHIFDSFSTLSNSVNASLLHPTSE